MATEHWVGDFKLDILCTEGDQQVVIENQLAETDHRHLGQILAYAAGVGARKVIWVAESFRPEHVAALQFLNRAARESRRARKKGAPTCALKKGQSDCPSSSRP